MGDFLQGKGIVRDDKAILKRRGGYDCNRLIHGGQIMGGTTLHTAMLFLLIRIHVMIRMDFKGSKEKTRQEEQRD